MDKYKYINISPITICQLNNILEKLIENDEYTAQFGNIKISYAGTYIGDVNGKNQIFQLIKKVEE